MSADSVDIDVIDNNGVVVRSFTGLSGAAGEHQHQWDGLDELGEPLTAGGAPYTYLITAHWDSVETATQLGNRRVKSRTLTIVVRDRCRPGTTWESGINEETIADPSGNPRNLFVDAWVSGGPMLRVPYYAVTPDVGPKQWDAEVRLLRTAATPWLLYTSPSLADGLPEIRSFVALLQNEDGVQDNHENKWDMDPELPGKQRTAHWSFRIGPDDSFQDFQETYE